MQISSLLHEEMSKFLQYVKYWHTHDSSSYNNLISDGAVTEWNLPRSEYFEFRSGNSTTIAVSIIFESVQTLFFLLHFYEKYAIMYFQFILKVPTHFIQPNFDQFEIQHLLSSQNSQISQYINFEINFDPIFFKSFWWTHKDNKLRANLSGNYQKQGSILQKHSEQNNKVKLLIE